MSRCDRPLSSQGRVEIGVSWYRISRSSVNVMLRNVTLVSYTVKRHLGFVAHGCADIIGVPAGPACSRWRLRLGCRRALAVGGKERLMGRRAKPAKAKVETKRPVVRKSSK